MPNFLQAFDLRKPKQYDPFEELFKLQSAREPDLYAPRDDAVDIESLSPEDPYDISFRQPETEEYLTHLRQRPRREDYEPSKGRKVLGGFLTGLLGSDFGITEAKHHKELGRWSDRGAGLKEGATFEQKGLVENRRRLKDLMSNAKANREYRRRVSEANRKYQMQKRELEELKLPELERRKLSDSRRNEYQNELLEYRRERDRQTIPLTRRRVDIAERSLEERTNRPLDPLQQKRINQEANAEVARDPRFTKWFNRDEGKFTDRPALDAEGKPKVDPETNQFEIVEVMPPEIKRMLQRAIAEAKDRIARRRRSDYSSPYGFDSLDYELMNEPSFDEEEEDESPFF